MHLKKQFIRFTANFLQANPDQDFPLSYFIPVYHTVSDDDLPHLKHIIQYKNTVKFEQDLDFLAKNFQFVSWEEFKDFVKGNYTPQKKIALLTFDDGLREFITTVAPILERKGIYAINFINPKFIDNQDLMFRCKASLLVEKIQHKEILPPELFNIFNLKSDSKFQLRSKILSLKYENKMLLDEIARLMEISFEDFLRTEKPYLTTENLNSLHKMGFGISSHGFDHPKYHELSLADQLSNTYKAQDYIKENHYIDESFAFPFTDFGVTVGFFEELFLKKKMFCTFGSAGIKEDSFTKNFQRVPMENGDSAKVTLESEMAYYKIKKIANKNRIVRK